MKVSMKIKNERNEMTINIDGMELKKTSTSCFAPGQHIATMNGTQQLPDRCFVLSINTNGVLAFEENSNFYLVKNQNDICFPLLIENKTRIKCIPENNKMDLVWIELKS